MAPEPPVEAIVREAAALWNTGQFFACHDKLEEAWRLVKHEKKAEPAKDPRRDAIHGIILYAAAYVHWTRGNTIGVERKLADARGAFARTNVERLGGLDLAGFRRAVERDLERAARGEAFARENVPAMVLQDAPAS